MALVSLQRLRLVHEDAQQAICDFDNGIAHDAIERRNSAFRQFEKLRMSNSLIVKNTEGKLAEILGKEALAYLATKQSL